MSNAGPCVAMLRNHTVDYGCLTKSQLTLRQLTLRPHLASVWQRHIPKFVCAGRAVDEEAEICKGLSFRLLFLAHFKHKIGHGPLSIEYGTCQTVTARFWPRFPGIGPQNLSSCALFARRRHPDSRCCERLRRAACLPHPLRCSLNMRPY